MQGQVPASCTGLLQLLRGLGGPTEAPNQQGPPPLALLSGSLAPLLWRVRRLPLSSGAAPPTHLHSAPPGPNAALAGRSRHDPGPRPTLQLRCFVAPRGQRPTRVPGSPPAASVSSAQQGDPNEVPRCIWAARPSPAAARSFTRGRGFKRGEGLPASSPVSRARLTPPPSRSAAGAR
ncbi:hypothetical protein NDU88_001768 [Pleurodeles waltl]|uniref:Uncharacterized protein n=1 Tax=Pleurodeles waltl TaxID=8319 RepID=A0AAV7WNC0_PLEWA|nr:hypothetical protein NDU88_001768 [Pleurodeles waltl]